MLHEGLLLWPDPRRHLKSFEAGGSGSEFLNLYLHHVMASSLPDISEGLRANLVSASKSMSSNLFEDSGCMSTAVEVRSFTSCACKR